MPVASHWTTVLLIGAAAMGPTLTAEAQTPQPARWSLQREVKIGSETTDYALTNARHLAVATDGTMFLAQPQDYNVRVFSKDGHFRQYLGRRGEGPGEFTAVGAVGIRGDTLWASDRRRLHYFTLTGDFIRTEPLRYNAGQPGLVPGGVNFVLADGAWAAAPAFALRRDPELWPSGLPVLRIERSDVIADTLGILDFSFVAFYRWDGSNQLGFRPLQPQFVHGFAPDGSAVFFVTQDAADRRENARFRLSRVDAKADTAFSRGVDYQPIPVPTSVRDSIHASSPTLGGVPMPRERVEAWLRAAPVPRFYPPVAAIVVGADHNLWLHMQGTSPRTWLILGPTGDQVAQVQTPTPLDILAADATHVWGIERDELDVPSLVRYRILREQQR